MWGPTISTSTKPGCWSNCRRSPAASCCYTPLWSYLTPQLSWTKTWPKVSWHGKVLRDFSFFWIHCWTLSYLFGDLRSVGTPSFRCYVTLVYPGEKNTETSKNSLLSPIWVLPCWRQTPAPLLHETDYRRRWFSHSYEISFYTPVFANWLRYDYVCLSFYDSEVDIWFYNTISVPRTYVKSLNEDAKRFVQI